MQGYYSVALGVLLSVAASIPARAETDLTGKWVGPFNGVQVEIPLRPGPFGWESGEARKSEGPRFIEASLQVDIEAEEGPCSWDLDGGRVQTKIRLRTDQSDCLELRGCWGPCQHGGHVGN